MYELYFLAHHMRRAMAPLASTATTTLGRHCVGRAIQKSAAKCTFRLTAVRNLRPQTRRLGHGEEYVPTEQHRSSLSPLALPLAEASPGTAPCPSRFPYPCLRTFWWCRCGSAGDLLPATPPSHPTKSWIPIDVPHTAIKHTGETKKNRQVSRPVHITPRSWPARRSCDTPLVNIKIAKILFPASRFLKDELKRFAEKMFSRTSVIVALWI